MLKSKLHLIVLASTALAIRAFAVDGVTLIDQATVTGAGGFPYVISQSGSYRLSGNLTTVNMGAIVIETSNVTLDLNGFTISCGQCTSHTGITATGTGATIRNGTVTGFGGSSGMGILFWGSGVIRAKVDHVAVTQNGSYGIYATGSAEVMVTNSDVSGNASVGISCPSGTLMVIDSKVSDNGLDGIEINAGMVTSSSIVGNGNSGSGLRGGIIVGTTASITNNFIAYNAVFGIAGEQPVIAGVGLNTFFGNTVDVGGAVQFSMKNNVNAGGVF